MFFCSKHTDTYPLLPFSQLVWEMTRLMPHVYTFTQKFVLHGGANRKQQVESALRTALKHHPVFSSGIDFRGRQYPMVLKDILHGKYHDFRLQAKGENLYIQCSVNRILGDGRSFEILAEDVLRAYEGKQLETDNYWGYLQDMERLKQSKHYADSKTWLEQEFGDESVPVRPTIDRRNIATLLPWKAGELTIDYTDIKSDVYRLTESEHLSLDGFFSLCVALAIIDYCGTDKAALTWAYEGRETPAEQHIIGSLHRDVPFMINKKSDGAETESREQLIRQARNQIRSGIAHSDYPYTLTRPNTKRWNYATNVIRSIDTEKSMLPNLEPLPQKPRKTAYAVLDVEYLDEPDSLRLTCRYSATHYKKESMTRFANLIRQKAEWMIKN